MIGKRAVILFLMLAVSLCQSALADRPILLVTPGGVFQAEVKNGVPGEWKPIAMDVIVQGFTPGNPTPPDSPDPPTEADPVVTKVSELAKSGLKDKAEATAVSALVDSLAKMGLSGGKLREALEMAAPIADSSMQASGRITKFVKAATAITVDPQKLKVGIYEAWGITQSTLNTIHSAAMREEGAAVPAEALDLMAIIALIKTIIELLQNLGLI